MIRSVAAMMLVLAAPALAASPPTPGPTADPTTTHTTPPQAAARPSTPPGPAQPSATGSTPAEVVAPK